MYLYITVLVYISMGKYIYTPIQWYVCRLATSWKHALLNAMFYAPTIQKSRYFVHCTK